MEIRKFPKENKMARQLGQKNGSLQSHENQDGRTKRLHHE
jgi:hypothetical protein